MQTEAGKLGWGHLTRRKPKLRREIGENSQAVFERIFHGSLVFLPILKTETPIVFDQCFKYL